MCDLNKVFSYGGGRYGKLMARDDNAAYRMMGMGIVLL